MTDLFTLAEFASYLQQDVDTSTATVVRRIANGWLLRATGQTDWPNPVPDDVFGWGLQLAAIAFRNPEGVASESIDDHNVSYDRSLRKSILDEAAAQYGQTGSPKYSFPEPDWHWAVVPTVSPLTA